eukprot:m.40746 g.40746  ORF g.40746 m.40746 type:complete len:192 (+) comp6943_c0_seq1:150-725(+)
MAATGMRPNKSGKELCLHVFYSIMLLITCVLATYAVGSPFWLNAGGGSVGILSACSDRKDLDTCARYGNNPKDIPVYEWRGAAGTFAFGIFVLWCSWIVSLVTCCCCQAATKPQRALIPIACLFITIGVILFGAGFGDPLIDTICANNAKKFDKGDCTFGDAGGAAIAAVVLGFITSLISCCVKPAEESFA